MGATDHELGRLSGAVEALGESTKRLEGKIDGMITNGLPVCKAHSDRMDSFQRDIDILHGLQSAPAIQVSGDPKPAIQVSGDPNGRNGRFSRASFIEVSRKGVRAAGVPAFVVALMLLFFAMWKGNQRELDPGLIEKTATRVVALLTEKNGNH